jgi:hypothetical protein
MPLWQRTRAGDWEMRSPGMTMPARLWVGSGTEMMAGSRVFTGAESRRLREA